jgi:hypothetical protein
MIYDFQDSFSKQLAGHVTSIIELKWEQDLESPPLVAHMWSFQLQRMGCSDQRVLPVRLQGQDVRQISRRGQRTAPEETPTRASQFRDPETL